MKQKFQSIAKITRPSISEIIPRERLFDLIDQGRGKAIIWISAPGGSGKTTLVSSYIDSRNLPALWYQLDESDGDVATFFHYMGEAAKKAAPRKRKPLPHLTPEYLFGLSTFAKWYFRELFKRLKKPFVLVFDNYQEVPDASSYHEVIQNAMSEISDGGSVIFISRNDPPKTMSRLRANQNLDIIGWDEIQLTAEETRDIASFKGYSNFTEETINILHSKTDGWIAGLVLMLEQLDIEKLNPDEIGEFIPETIFDYFSGEIFEKMDTKLRTFLLKTAFLRTMTIDEAKELSGIASAEKILKDLNKKNCFTIKHGRQKIKYQYHPLFREFLVNQAEEQLSDSELKALIHNAASILEKSERFENAAELYQRIAEWQEIVRLVNQFGPQLASQGRFLTIGEWLKQIPVEIYKKNPMLLYWKGLCALPFNTVESRDYFAHAFEALKAVKAVDQMYLALAGGLTAVTMGVTEGDQFIPLLKKLDWLQENYPDSPSPLIRDQVAYEIFWAYLNAKPDHPQFESWVDHTAKVVNNHPDPRLRIASGCRYAHYLGWHGDFRKALLIIDSLLELHRTHDGSDMDLVIISTTETYLSWQSCEIDRSIKAAQRGLKIAETKGVHIWDYAFMAFSAAAYMTVGKHEEAQKLLDRIAPVAGQIGLKERMYYHNHATHMSLLKGDLSDAEAHADLAIEYAHQVPREWEVAECYYGKSLILYKQRQYKKSLKYLHAVQKVSKSMKSELLMFMYLSARAMISLEQGHKKEGVKFIKQLIPLGREKDLMNCWYFMPEEMAKICEIALEEDIETEYVKKLIRKRNLATENPPVHIDDWPWPVKIYTLGRLSILKDGKPLRFSSKARKKPVDLLRAIIALGGRDVNDYQLADALWPESDADASHKALKTTVFRLRNLLGIDDAIIVNHGKITLNNKYCWVDAWTFERMAGSAEEASKGKQTDRKKKLAVKLSQKAVDLYHGHFLAGEEHPWTVSMRERLRSIALRHTGRLGNYLEKSGKYEDAVDLYRKAIEMDGLAEESYQHLMNCYLRLGKKAEALSVYKKCRNTLSTVFGITPSSRTEKIYRSIKKL